MLAKSSVGRDMEVTSLNIWQQELMLSLQFDARSKEPPPGKWDRTPAASSE